MSPAAARRAVFIALILFVPVPYLMAVHGSVPPLRFLWLSIIAMAYSIFVDGSGVAWMLTLVLATHVLLYGVVAWICAATLIRLLPNRARTLATVGLCLMLASIGLIAASYQTPFGPSADATWWQLLR